MSSRDDLSPLDGAALDRLWDAMNRQIAPISGRAPSASTEVAHTIRLLEQRDDAPALGNAQLEAMWATVAAATLTGLSGTAELSDAAPTGVQRGFSGFLRTVLDLLQRAVRQSAIGAMAGILVGTLVLGGGSRVFMRISGMLSEPQRQGMMTENGNKVGEITLSGTLGLLFFVGALFGLFAGIAVMAVRPWLPVKGPMRYLVTGAIGFAVAGPIVLEGGENADYQRFGIFGLNVCLFTTLPFLFGVAVIPIIDWLDRRISQDLPGVSRGWRDVPKSVFMVILFIPALQLIVAAIGLEPVGLLLILPVFRAIWPLWARHAPTREMRHKRDEIGIQIGRAVLLVPCVLGLVLMAEAISRLTL